jgi:hypothetical protein
MQRRPHGTKGVLYLLRVLRVWLEKRKKEKNIMLSRGSTIHGENISGVKES